MNQNIGVLERNVDSIESIRVTDLTFLSYFLLKTPIFLPFFCKIFTPDARLISQQRESLMLRRHSDDNKKSRKARKLLRSKSMDVQSNLEASKNEKPEKEKDLSQPLNIEVDQCT